VYVPMRAAPWCTAFTDRADLMRDLSAVYARYSRAGVPIRVWVFPAKQETLLSSKPDIGLSIGGSTIASSEPAVPTNWLVPPRDTSNPDPVFPFSSLNAD